MNKLVIYLLDESFYYSPDDNCVYCVDDDKKQFGYNELYQFINKIFNMDEDRIYGLVFNWLVDNKAPLVRKNWNKRFIAHNVSIDSFNQNVTEDIDFKYVIVDD